MKLKHLVAFSALGVMAFGTPPAMAGSKDFIASGYTLPADKPVTIMVMRPDVNVGQLEVGGVVTPKPDWTDNARSYLATALEKNQAVRSATIVQFDAAQSGQEKLVSDYEYLHRSVATSILTHKYYGAKLPTKKGKFDWTLGSEMAQLGKASNSNYALFLYIEDSFSSDARKATQVVGALGCIVGFCVIRGGGIHRYYASLVELETGNVVWFNVLRGSKGDVREEEGAQKTVDALFASMPTKPGEGVKEMASTK